MRTPFRLIGLMLIPLMLSACTLSWPGSKPPTTINPPVSVSPPVTSDPSPAPGNGPSTAPAQPAPWIDADRSPFAVRGIVEGFYGAPWTTGQRLAAFDFMARVGMNTYVYAPKDDPYQRARWRSPYPDAELARFRTLLDRAGQDGVRFVYSISPGLDITYSSEADRQALAAKVDQLRSIGIHTFMFSVDDVPERLTPADAALYGTNYGLAQADLANWLWRLEQARDPQFALWMTPSHYWGTTPDAYLTSLGARLDKAIPLVWTGPDVLSETITAADSDRFAAIVGRKAIIWDNYPVNDYTYVQKKKPRLIMGPLRGRDPNLAEHVSGYLLNPMIQAEASQLPLFTAAAYLADPAGYRPEAAWVDGTHRLATSGAGAAALLEFAGFAQISAVYGEEAPDLAAAIDAYQTGSATGAAADLRSRFGAMVSLPGRLAAGVTPGLYDEVAPWAQALSDKGELGLRALEVDEAVRAGDSAAVAAKLPGLKATLASVQAGNSKAYIAIMLVENFAQNVIDRAGRLTK